LGRAEKIANPSHARREIWANDHVGAIERGTARDLKGREMQGGKMALMADNPKKGEK